MKKTRVLLVEENPLVQTTVSLALPTSQFTIVGTATNRCETLQLLAAHTPDLVVISPSVLEKTGMGLVREVIARGDASVLVMPGHPIDLFARALSLLRPADLGRLVAIVRVVQTLFGRRKFVLN
jgi:DNA-binding NarL/FixJ family response regulator